MTYALSHGSQIGALTLAHLGLVVSALCIALCIALPLGIYGARRRSARAPLFGALGAIYAIPSLAALALLVRYNGLGFWTAVIVLVAYAQFILVRNITAAFAGVPRTQVDAARGVGMSSLQCLLRVELPLAMPVLLGGVRLATVALISLATLAAYAGAGGLGTLIFDGLGRQYLSETLAGSVPAALLAIVADQGFRALERRRGGHRERAASS